MLYREVCKFDNLFYCPCLQHIENTINWKCTTENACRLVFRTLVTMFLCFVVKAISRLLWVRCYSNGEALPEGLCCGHGLPGLGVVSASQPSPLHALCVVTVAAPLCRLPIKSCRRPSSELPLFSAYLTWSLSKNRRKMSLRTYFYLICNHLIVLLWPSFFNFQE